MRRLRALAAAVGCLLVIGPLLSTSVQAQALATLQGVVTDDTNTPIPGVTVRITNQDTGALRTSITDERGVYRAPALQPGVYSVSATLQGLQSIQRENVRLLVGQVIDINLKMTIETMSEVITVTADAPIVEISRTSAAKYVTEEQIEALPIAGRDFVDFALLTPAVKAEPVRGGVSMAGQRGISTGLNVDGTEGKSTFFAYGRGGEATENDGLVVAQDSVKEFQIITNGFAPEYGRNGGGYINVVTKSGTNDLHGSAFFYLRNESMVSDLPLSPLDKLRGNNPNRTPDEFERLNWGATVGGPIIKDKTHFFLSYDHLSREEPFQDFIRTPGVYDALVQRGGPFLNLVNDYTRQSDGSAVGSFTRSVDNLILFAKVDHQIADNHSVQLRYNFTDYERSSDFRDEEVKFEKTHSFVGQIVSVLGSNAVNELRVHYARDDLDRTNLRIGEPIQAEIRFQFGNFDSVGKFDFLPIIAKESLFQIQNNFSYIMGNHDLKFGIDYQAGNMKQLFAGSRDGRYDYTSIENFLNNVDNGVRIYFGDVTYPNYDETQHTLGIYAQNSYKPSTSLTLNFGLRWDATFNPQGLEHALPEGEDIPNDLNNFSPRVGFAYSPDDEGKSVVRGGAGLFYSRTPSLLFASQVQENGLFPNFGRVFVRNGQPGYVPLGQPIPNENPPPQTRPSTSFVAPGFGDPGTWRFNLGYERELLRDVSAGVDLLYARSFDLQTNVDLNRQIASYDEFGRPIYSSQRIDTRFDTIFVRESIGRSNYVAATFSVNKRWSKGYQVQAHYTWSQDKDNDDNERSATTVTITDQTNIDYDYGLSSRDVKHRFVLSGVAELPLDFKLSGIVNVQSGSPYSLLDANTNYHRYPGGGAGPFARAVVNGQLVARNTERNEAYSKVDVRLTKFFDVSNFRIEAFAEVFNLFDQHTFNVGVGQSQPILSNGNANDALGVGSFRVTDQRQVQLGARFSF
jgi:outer membrane receptor protein involved in Fe transport